MEQKKTRSTSWREGESLIEWEEAAKDRNHCLGSLLVDQPSCLIVVLLITAIEAIIWEQSRLPIRWQPFLGAWEDLRQRLELCDNLGSRDLSLHPRVWNIDTRGNKPTVISDKGNFSTEDPHPHPK